MPGHGLTPVLAAAFLFNLGQGALRPSMPLYLQRVFAARYGMVTLIPVVFGAGRWLASLPTGYLLDRLGRRPLMVSGLLVVAASDVGSALTSVYGVFLGLRAIAGAGWATFGTVATALMVQVGSSARRGRAVSLLAISETLGLLLGTSGGGWLYQRAGMATPFLFEAACMVLATVVLACAAAPAGAMASAPGALDTHESRALSTVLRIPGVLVLSLTNAALTAVQTGLVVFLVPLYLANRGELRAETVGLVVSLGVLGRLAALWLGGSVASATARTRILVRGLIVYAVLLSSMTLVVHPVALALWTFALGGAAGLVAPLPTALLGDRVPAAHQAVAVGWLRTVTDTGQMVGALAMGLLADAWDLSTPFLVAGALLAATAWRCRRSALAWPLIEPATVGHRDG